MDIVLFITVYLLSRIIESLPISWYMRVFLLVLLVIIFVVAFLSAPGLWPQASPPWRR